MSANVNNSSIETLIKDALKEDGGFYLAVITLLGYCLTTVQHGAVCLLWGGINIPFEY